MKIKQNIIQIGRISPVAMPYDLDMKSIWDFFAFSVNMV